jgi:hypothetical protein
MAPYNLDAPRIGTADTLVPYRRVDSRACFKCGAVAGRCEHLASDADIVWLSNTREKPIAPPSVWSPEDKETIRRLYVESELTFDQIADLMNTTRSAVSGILHRMGVRRA